MRVVALFPVVLVAGCAVTAERHHVVDLQTEQSDQSASECKGYKYETLQTLTIKLSADNVRHGSTCPGRMVRSSSR